MISEVTSSVAPSANGRDEKAWKAAEQLHVALFTEFFRYSGLLEAISVDGGPLDTYSETLIRTLADDVVRSDPDFTKRLYRQMTEF
ncbi:MAG: hypothetical protein HRU11_12300 [Parvularculaceae bacterium]|nr:hypothetical protein [Parvularculaceae bacterium]